MQELKQVQGNQLVQEGLQKAVERARGGTVRACAILFCENTGVDIALLGDEKGHSPLVLGAEMLKHVIITQLMNVKHMGNTVEAPANMVQYDLAEDPICFDFLPWLVSREMDRRREGAPPPLRIGFSRNARAIRQDTPYKKKFIETVMRPMLTLFGVVEDGNAATMGRKVPYAALKEIAAGFRAGETIPRINVSPTSLLEAAEWLRQQGIKGPPVTLTLRETDGAYEHRNSDLAEWHKLAQWLCVTRHEDVVVVRDTHMAREPFHDYTICPQASEQLLFRAALYESAKCNLFVTNGPWGLAYLGSRPWLMFATVDDDQTDEVNRPLWWQTYMGLDPNGQLPWAQPSQRIIYAPDKFDYMSRAYEELFPLPLAEAAE